MVLGFRFDFFLKFFFELVGGDPDQGVGDPVAGLSVGGRGGVNVVDGVVLVAGGDLVDAGAVVPLHLHLVDVHVGLAGVMAVEDGVREHGVAAHHGAVVELGV